MTRFTRRKRRPLRPVLPPLLLLALGLCAPAAARAETVWVDGYEVEITLHPAKVMLGEPVRLSLEVANRSDTDLELMLSGEEGRGWPDGFEVSVTGPGGAPARRAAPKLNSTRPSTITVRAGRSLHLILAPEEWAAFERPGLYTVNYRRGLRAAPFNGRETVLLDVEKPAVEFRVRAEVEVTPADGERLGRLIEELGSLMLNAAPDAGAAAARLATFNDERIVKHFVEAYRRSRNASVKVMALQVFTRFRSDLALEGLKLGAADPGDDFRTAAAAALSQSKHPGAARVLAGMRRDPYYGVRLVVLYALEAMNTRAARRMIWELTNDPHEGVKSEALRILGAPSR